MNDGWHTWQSLKQEIEVLATKFESKVKEFNAELALATQSPTSNVASWPKWRNNLRTMVRYPNASKLGKVYAAYTTITILLSISAMMAATMQNVRVNEVGRNVVFLIQCVCAVAFTIDLIVDFVVIPPGRWKQELGRFYFIIDVLSVVPFWVALFISLAREAGVSGLGRPSEYGWIMCLRVLRLFKLVDLAGPDSKVQFLLLAVSRSKFGFLALIVTYPLLVIFWGTLVYYMEFTASFVDPATGVVYYDNGELSGFQNIPVSLWFMIVTLSTTGYGDIIPQTVQGRLVTSAAIVCGVFLIAFPLTIVSGQYGDVVNSWKEKKKSLDDAQNAIEDARAAIVWVSMKQQGSLADPRIQICKSKIQQAMELMDLYLEADQARQVRVRRAQDGTGDDVDETDEPFHDVEMKEFEQLEQDSRTIVQIKASGPELVNALTHVLRSNFPDLQFQIT